MPTLDWIGKKAVVNHHHQVPYHLLKDVPDLSVGDPGTGNLIVEGDNLLALKALLPYYAGQVKCIYIDPPYNTGNEGWGAAVIPRLARDIRNELPEVKGFSERNIKRMLAFAREYPTLSAIVPQAAAQLPASGKGPQVAAQIIRPLRAGHSTAAGAGRAGRAAGCG